MAFLPLEIRIMLLSQFPLTFHHIHSRMSSAIALLMIGTVYVIIWEMFHGRISLNLVLLLLLVNFVSGFRLELMYISLIESIRSSLTHFHGFQQLVLLPYFIEIPFFVCTKRINLLNLKYISDTLVIVANGFLKLPNLHMLIRVHHFPETWLSGLLANCQLCLQQR